MEERARSLIPAHSRSRRALIGKSALALILILGVHTALYKVVRGTYPDAGISGTHPRYWIDLSEQSTPERVTPTEKPALRVAVASVLSLEKSLKTYQEFTDYVAGKLKRQPIYLYRSTFSEINDLVRYQRCDIAIVRPYPFIRGEWEFGMQAIVVPQLKSGLAYQSFILVPTSSPAKSLMDLRRKRFASADIISTTGWLFPATVLEKAGDNPNTFFSEHLLVGTHDRAIRAVMDGFVDAAAVLGPVYDQMAVEDPFILKKTKILIKSPHLGVPPIVMHPAVDPKLKSQVQSVLLNMDKDQRGKQILEKLQIEKFVLPERRPFKDLRQAVGKLEGWK